MIALWVLTISVSAARADFCEPLADLHEKISFCEDNPGYLPPAQACHDQYKAYVASKQAEVKALLAAQANAGVDHAQNLKFDTTKNVYQTTDDTLSELINSGHKVLSELDAYGEDFVPPMPPDEPGYWKPDRKDPNDPGRSLDNYCWAEPMGDLDVIQADVQITVDQLSITREEARKLHGITGDRDTKLRHLAEDDGLAARHRGVSGGGAANGDSTVTGRIRNDKLDSGTPGAKARAPGAIADAASPAGAAPSTMFGDRARWVETYKSALQGRDGQLAAPDGAIGSALSLPSLEAAKGDTAAKSTSPIAGAAEVLLDQAAGGAPAAAAIESAGIANGASPGRALASLSADESALHAGSSALESIAGTLTPAPDARDLFQRAHSAYERSRKRNRI